MLELIIFLALGVLIYLLFLLRDKKIKRGETSETAEETRLKGVSTTNSSGGDAASGVSTTNSSEPQDEECCGQHLVCERDSLLTQHPDIEYYDDEELDILRGIDPADYTDEQIQMLQGVFYTLQESDVAGWVRSLQMRNIALTPELREEALLIVRERRTR